MALVTVGSGGTIKSPTAEGQLLEIFDFLQLSESDAMKNPNGRDYIKSAVYDASSYVFSGSFSFPYRRQLNASGQLLISVDPYLSNVTFTPPVDGTFKSTNPAAYLFEVAMYCQELEGNSTKNPNNINNVSISFDDDSLTVTGTITCSFKLTLNADGTRKIEALPYLL